MFILLLVAAADALVVKFVRKPFPWVGVITALGPVLTSLFVVIPLLRAENGKVPDA